jgi:hypothetical protein
MNDTTIFVITIVSCIFSYIMVKTLNVQWFQRLDAKYKHEKALAKLRKRGVAVKTPPPSSPLDWVEKLKGLDPEILHSLIDSVSGESPLDLQEGGMTDYLIDLASKNPDLVQNFLAGLNKGKGEQQESDGVIYNK